MIIYSTFHSKLSQILLILLFFLFNYQANFIQANTLYEDDYDKQIKVSDSAAIYNQMAKDALYENLEMTKFCALRAIQLAGENQIERALGFHNLGMYYYFRWEPEHAIENYQISVEINRRTGNFVQLSKTYNNLGAIYDETGENKKALEYFIQALQCSRKVDDSTGVARALGNMSNIYQGLGNYALSLQMSRQAYKIREMLGDTLGMASTLMNLGITYKNIGDYETALNMYFNALKVYEKTKDNKSVGNVLFNIANVYYDWKRYDDARKYYHEALIFYDKVEISNGLAYVYNQIGNIFKEEELYDSAYICYQKALVIFEKIQVPTGEANVNADLADLYCQWNKTGQALKFAEKAENLYLNLEDKVGLVEIFATKVNIQMQSGDYLKALDFANRSLQLADEMKNKRLKLGSLLQLSAIYDSLEQFRKAYYYLNEFKILNDSVFDEKMSRQVAELNTLYQIDKKEKEIEIHKAETKHKSAELSRQKIITRSLSGGVFALFVIIGLIVWAYIQKRKTNRQIMMKNDEIENKNQELFAQNEEIISQRDHILKQHKEITDSINYAQFIQNALLPSPSVLNQIFNKHFIMYRPRNVVSGDFYWVKQVNDITVIAVADCTGHSVPGAFMSILGISLLNEMVRNTSVFDPSQILEQLRIHLKQVLSQDTQNSKSRDSIDMALCIIDHDAQILSFSGAKIPLLMIYENKINEFAPDNMTVGYNYLEKIDFKTQVVHLLPGMQFYLYSDGYSDQFGGPQNHKFKKQHLKSHLLENSILPFNQQLVQLEKAFDEWKGNYPQIDDVMVIGFNLGPDIS